MKTEGICFHRSLLAGQYRVETGKGLLIYSGISLRLFLVIINRLNEQHLPGRPSFDTGLGGEADRPRGGGLLVLGLESGVRGILGLETKGVSYGGLNTKKQKQRKMVC